MCRIFPALLALASVAPASAAWVAPAWATPEYPAVIDAKLTVTCGEPRARCLICHTTARGGQGTAEQPFARELGKLGLNRGHETSALVRALTQLEGLDQQHPEDPQDSDDDGVSDLEELSKCGNPSGDDLGSGPVYGCDGAHLAPSTEPSPVLGALALGLAALLVERGRRR
jgi:hypothetical protein